MPITTAFTITSALAVFVHALYLRRVYLNRREQRKPGQANGDRRRIADAFFNMEITRFLLNLCLLFAGLGLLLHFRAAGYLLAGPPVLSLLSSTFALRGIR